MNWNDKSPIYMQVASLIQNQIADGLWAEGERLPSVRQLATDLKINHLTVMKAMQQLIDLNLVEKQRGVGMNVSANAQTELLNVERERFYSDDLPALKQKLSRLQISANELTQLLEREDNE